jgi:hypothetical protein
MEPLPPEALPPVQHVIFGIFNLAIPNILAWFAIVVVLFVYAWARFPMFIEPAGVTSKEVHDESDTSNQTFPEGQPNP